MHILSMIRRICPASIMHKEVIIAISLGIFIGLVSAFGIWRVNKVVTSKPEYQASKPELKETTTKSEPNATSLTLARPENLDVIVENPVEIAGVTSAQSIVVVSGEDEDYITTLDASGSFTQEVELSGGLNEIRLTAFAADGNTVEQNLTLVYSEEFGKILDQNDKSATDSAKPKEKAQEKLTLQKSNPKAYVGTVTDKTEDSLQIRNTAGEIQLISVLPEDVSFVKLNDKSSLIKYDDVAIGDFLAALGFQNGNGVLAAKRIIVTSPPAAITIKIIYGEIIDIEKGEISIKEVAGTNWNLKFPRRWKGPEKSELEEGQKIIAVGTPEGNTLAIRTIQIISPLEE